MECKRRRETVTVTGQAEYDRVANAPQLVLFLFGPGSPESHTFLPRFTELARRASRDNPSTLFVVLDFSSELMTPFWDRMNIWFEEQGVARLGYHGYGKTLWVSNGSVIHWVPNLADQQIDDLVIITAALFSADTQSK